MAKGRATSRKSKTARKSRAKKSKSRSRGMSKCKGSTHWVKGYHRSDGARVAGHCADNPRH